jgi:hypothetical protein
MPTHGFDGDKNQIEVYSKDEVDDKSNYDTDYFMSLVGSVAAPTLNAGAVGGAQLELNCPVSLTNQNITIKDIIHSQLYFENESSGNGVDKLIVTNYKIILSQAAQGASIGYIDIRVKNIGSEQAHNTKIQFKGVIRYRNKNPNA